MAPVLASTLVGLGGQALAPALGAAGRKLAEVVDPEARAYQKQLRKDTAALQQGKLGLSEAEKRNMLAGTQRALQAQTAGVEANLRRQAAAMGGFGRSGAQTKALSSLAAGQGEQMAQAAGRLDTLSQQVAQQRFQDVMGRLSRQRDEARLTAGQLGGAAAAAVQEGVAAFPAIKSAQLMQGVTDALEKLKLAKAGGDSAAIEAAKKAYDEALKAGGF